MLNLCLRVSNDPGKIRCFLGLAFCPIECSIGGESITDDLLMDHHGEHSKLEGVAIRAYRDHFGCRAEHPNFVTCSPVDADACFATAALAGLLPHPSRSEWPPWLKTDITELAETINKLDVEPVGLNPLELPGGDKVLAWNALTSGCNRDDLGYMAGVGLWVQLTTADSQSPLFAPLLEGVKKSEEGRRRMAVMDLADALLSRGSTGVDDADLVLSIYESSSWGFDVWYSRLHDYPADSAKGWAYPVVLALAKQSREITIGCPNQTVAEHLFGEGGLKTVFGKLEPEGWGGREAIGGSPRGAAMTEKQLKTAANKAANMIRWPL